MSPHLASSMSDSSSSSWFFTYANNLKFFSLVRRFLHKKAAGKRCGPSDRIGKPRTIKFETEKPGGGEMGRGSDREDGTAMQRSVKRLHFGSNWEEKETAAEEIKRFAREDVKKRKLLAELGVIPALVAMVDSEVLSRRRLAVQALIELANGSFTNKAVMVEAGILSKLPHDATAGDETINCEFARLLLSLSSLPNAQFPLPTSQILPFLLDILHSTVSTSTTFETKDACLGTLFNLSTTLPNAELLVSSGAVPTLLMLSPAKEASEKALATLGNLAVTIIGKKAMENSDMVPERLIEIMTWEEKPKCQELSAYILMILAHRSSAQRKKMAESGIVPVLLEVALLGSPLAQKRALKLLQWFKDERQIRIGAHSGPQTGRVVAIGSPLSQKDTLEEKKVMKNMVKQSLYKNLEVITRRANGARDCSKFKSLDISSSSKSLPY
ncbi:U-box domain-containing protein 7 [Malania oleifera]|uniref:U-box domain-containing protein 7 n=1 Tax=Malania oleifera TaxID=397392 RepID=UPI0025AE85D3|nr:U-box domain-containing protein 7 [Malania oleifera]